MVDILGYISVQPDWTVDIKNALNSAEGPHQFWASAYKQNQQSIHDTIQVSKDPSSSESTTLVSLTSQEISAEFIDTRHVRLSNTKLDIPPTLYTAPKKTANCSRITRKSGISCFDVSPLGGLLVACGDEGRMDVYEVQSGNIHRVELVGHLGDVTCCRFFPSGQVVLSGATDMRLRVWSASDGTNPVTMTGHTGAITDLGIVSRGRNVVSSAKDGAVRLWHCGSGSTIHTFALSAMPVNKIDIATNKQVEEAEQGQLDNEFETKGKILAAACEDGRAVLLDLCTKQVIAELGALGDTPVRALAYDVASNRVYTGLSNGAVCVWDIDESTSAPVYSFMRNGSAISAIRLVFRSNESAPLVCVGTEDGQLYLASLETQAGGKIVKASVVEELVAFDVDPVSQIRVLPSNTEGIQRQSIWASGRDNKAYEF
ncbi:hypothetical protein GGI07_005119 [Coemansia sp. Benny D115]|nr:hypothetical protein GGI07_005119 [Coemansia sp. Benny D115]